MAEPVRTYEYDSRPWIYVRTEVRDISGGKVPEHLFISKDGRVPVSRWFQNWPEEFAPVNDTGGRAEATHWAMIAEGERAKVDALTKSMRALIGMVDSRAAEQARDIYIEELEKAGVKL